MIVQALSGCRQCDRLASFLDQVRQDHPTYFCAPVPPFGDARAKLLVVGLAPGLHGANATGRPFTGDACSDLLYGTLHAHGFSSQPQSLGVNDGLQLRNCRITNAVKCLPPANKPTGAEVERCGMHLRGEIQGLAPSVILALGAVSHQAVLKALEIRVGLFPFGHGRLHDLPSLTLVDSYHPSRYNVNTGRLTPEMFHAVVGVAKGAIGQGALAR